MSMRSEEREMGPKRMKDRVGMKVATLIDLRNGLGVIPAGTKGVVRRAFGGADLDIEACPTCGLKPRIARVSWHALEPI